MSARQSKTLWICDVLLSTFIILLIGAGTVHAQQCDQCSHPRIGFYDCDVMVPRPANADSVPGWWTLAFPGAVAEDQFMNNDPSKSCITIYNGALMNALVLQGGTLKYGHEYANLPPAGPINTVDYLIVESVTGSNGSYQFTLQLQAGPSREVVKSVSVPFTITLDNSSAISAGSIAASEFIPLFGTVRDFEVHKRNTDLTVAVRDLWNKDSEADISVKPQKTEVDTGETIDVDIEMIDCDGVALGNRQIMFCDTTVYDLPLNGTTGGEIDPMIVTTDGSGKATVKFTAGHTAGDATINAWYPHMKPCGRPGAFMGTALVQVRKPSTERWKLDITLNASKDIELDSSNSGSALGYPSSVSNHYESHASGTAHVSAIVENGSAGPGEFVFDSDFGDPDCTTVSGSAEESDFSDYVTFWGLNECPYAGTVIQKDYWCGNVVPGSPRFSFYFTQAQKFIGMSFQCYRTGDYEVRGSEGDLLTGCWGNGNGVYDDANGSFNGSGGSDDNGSSFTGSDSAFSARCSNSETHKEAWGGGTATFTTTVSLKATARPAGGLTGIQPDAANRLPQSYALSQSYPNPFNPSAVIKYQIPERSFAALKIYDVLGREVRTVVSETEFAGYYSVTFEARNLSSGLYFYRLEATSVSNPARHFSQTRKMLLVR